MTSSEQVATRSSNIESALQQAKEAFAASNPESASQLNSAAEFMPGGNTRTVLFYPPYPLTMTNGAGCHLWDLDGHLYIDFIGEFTAGIYGHSDPIIRAAIENALANGINLSAHNLLEGRLAEALCERLPSLESVRFTNSGTEANLMAIALAKAATGRTKILIFDGAYHGSVISFVGGPSRLNVPHDFIAAPYNDPGATRELIASNAQELAAVLVEPMLGAGGCIPADEGFLATLRTETQRTGALLIFDEVMTSRLSFGGRQELLGITPDLTVVGKYFGGGLAFGAFGGRRDLMQAFDPRRSDYLSHPGIFNNNTLTMAAGLAGLTQLYTKQAASELNSKGEELRRQLNDLFGVYRAPLQFTGLGSLMNIHPLAGTIKRPSDATQGDRRLSDLYFCDLLAEGIYIARRGLVALTLPIGDLETSEFVRSTERFLGRRGYLFN